MDGGGGGGLGESVPSQNQLWDQVVGIQSGCSGSGSELEASRCYLVQVLEFSLSVQSVGFGTLSGCSQLGYWDLHWGPGSR